jgi:hypothetical protein
VPQSSVSVAMAGSPVTLGCDWLAHRFGNAAENGSRQPHYPTDMTDAEWGPSGFTAQHPRHAGDRLRSSWDSRDHEPDIRATTPMPWPPTARTPVGPPADQQNKDT